MAIKGHGHFVDINFVLFWGPQLLSSDWRPEDPKKGLPNGPLP